MCSPPCELLELLLVCLLLCPSFIRGGEGRHGRRGGEAATIFASYYFTFFFLLLFLFAPLLVMGQAL